MRSIPRLGAANLALVSVYFAPVWGLGALRALTSPFPGFEDRAHAAAAIYVRHLFDLGLDGLMWTSSVLAGLKLVIAAGFVAYLIEFARAVVVGREPNRETLDAVLALAAGAIVIWVLPALALDDAAQIRLHATQLLLMAGAVVVITVERHVEESAPAEPSRAAAAAPAAPPCEPGRPAPAAPPLGPDHRPWLERLVGLRKAAGAPLS